MMVDKREKITQEVFKWYDTIYSDHESFKSSYNGVRYA